MVLLNVRFLEEKVEVRKFPSVLLAHQRRRQGGMESGPESMRSSALQRIPRIEHDAAVRTKHETLQSVALDDRPSNYLPATRVRTVFI